MDDGARLTGHEKRVVCAMLLAERMCGRSTFFARHEIARIVYLRCGGIQSRTMRSLAKKGMAEPESADAVRLVAAGICTCGCDRWRLSAGGREWASAQNIRVPAMTRRQAWLMPRRREKE